MLLLLFLQLKIFFSVLIVPDLTQEQEDCTLYPFMGYGIISKYIPLGAKYYQYQQLNTDILYFLGQMTNSNTGDLFYLYYIQIMLSQRKIIHHLNFKQDNVWNSQIVEYDAQNYEGQQICQYFYYDNKQNEFVNKIFSIKASNKIEIHINNMDLQYFKFTIGGAYKGFNPLTNEKLNLQIFPGTFERVNEDQINIQMDIDIDFFNDTPDCYDVSAVLDEKILIQTSNAYQIYNLATVNIFYYKLSFWVMIDEELFDSESDQQINIIRISANRFTINFQDTGSNSFVIKYVYSSTNQQWTINIEYYSYDVPVIIQFQNYDDPYSRKDEILINDSQCLFTWQYIVIEYDPNKLNFQFDGSLNNCKYLRRYENVYQFSNILYKLFFGGSIVDSNTLGLEVATISFYYCNQDNYICHYTCQTCFGPLRNQCLSCSKENNRIFNEKFNTCPCQLWFNEYNQSSCQFFPQNFDKTQISFSLNATHELEINQQYQCNFGEFIYEQNCYKCPSASQDNYITCVECLQNPLNWIYGNPTCSQTYHQDDNISQNYLLLKIDDSKVNIQFLFQFDELIQCYGCYLCYEDQEGCYLSKFYHLNQQIYIKCQESYTFVDGECQISFLNSQFQQCSYGCKKCDENGYCLECKTDNNYFININGQCQICQIFNCLKCFQYNSQNIFVNSLFHVIDEQILQNDDYQVICIQCKDNFHFSFQTEECLKNNQDVACQYFINEQGTQVCFSSNANSNYNQLQQIEECELYLPNCKICIHKSNLLLSCILCEYGYYINILNGSCKGCNRNGDQISECFIDSQNGDKYKLELIGVYQTIIQDFYDITQLYNKLSKFTVINCIEQYSVDKTYESCSINCQNCEDCQFINDQYQCLKCSGQDDLGNVYYSQINGTCYKCPLMCQFCMPLAIEQINAYNPYYIYDAAVPPLMCLQNYDDSLTYIDFLSGQLYPIDSSTRKKSYFAIEASELFRSVSDDNPLINSDMIKNSPLFSFTLHGGIIQTNLFNQSYTLKEFNINDIINTKSKSNEFYNISMYTCHKCRSDQYSISSIYGMKIILTQITFLKKQLINKSLYNLSQVKFFYGEVILVNSSFFQQSYFLDIEDFYSQTEVTLKNIHFINSNFTDSAFVQLKSTFQIDYFFEQIIFQNCILDNFSFINSISNQIQNLQIKEFIIINCTVLNSVLINFSFAKSRIQLVELTINQSIFNNSYLLQASGQFNIQKILFDEFNLEASVIFLLYFENSFNEINITQMYCKRMILHQSTVFKISPKKQTNQIILVIIKNLSFYYPFQTDSYFLSAEQVNVRIENVNIQNQYIFPLFYFINCNNIILNQINSTSNGNQNYNDLVINQEPMIKIYNFQSIQLNGIYLNNLLKAYNQLVFITSAFQSSQEIIFSNVIIQNTQFLNTKTINGQLIFISILSESIIIIKNCMFESIQFYYETILIQSQLSSLIQIASQSSQIIFNNLSFLNMQVNNSSESLIKLESDLIIFTQITVANINIGNNTLLKSMCGFAYILSQKFEMTDSSLQNISSVFYGFFFIQLKFQGTIRMENCKFNNSIMLLQPNYIPQLGGIFTIDAQFSELNLSIQNIVAEFMLVTKSSSIINLLPSSSQNQVFMNQIVLLNVFQQDAFLMSFNFPQISQGNKVQLINLHQRNHYQQLFQNYSIDDFQLNTNFIGMLIANTELLIYNLSIVGFINEPILSVVNCSAIKINYFLMQEISIARKIQYLISFTNSNLYLKDVIIKNISTEYQLQTIINFDTSTKTLTILNSEVKFIDCNNCIQALTCFNSITNLRLLGIIFYKNKCGQNTCLLIQNSSAILQESYFLSNEGKVQGIVVAQDSKIRLKQSILKNNFVQGFSGALYFTKTNFFVNQSYIINNSALQTGGLYQTQEKLLVTEQNQFYFLENNSTAGVENVWELPEFLSLSMYDMIIKTKREIQGNIIIDEPSYLINSKQQRLNQTFFNVSSGQQLNEFKIFDKTTMKYAEANLSLQLRPFSQLGERVVDSSLSYCSISQILVDIDKNYSIIELLTQKKEESINKISFDQETLSIQLGSLIYHLDPYNNTSDYILTATQCDFMDDNYYFIFKVKTLKCQIGEYYSNEECLKCDFEKGFYSVEVNSTSCQKMDPEFIKSISLSSIELQKGYWRLSYYQNNIEKCDNDEVCLGGEQVSYNSCKIGYLGAICGACDLYNIRGESQFILNFNSECERKAQQEGFVILLFIETIGLFAIAYLISSFKYQMQQQYKTLKQQTIHYRILYKCQLDQQNTIIKSFINFTQILYPLLPSSFQLFNITFIIWPFGYSSKIVEYFIQFFSDQFKIEIIYLKLLGAILLPFVQISFLGFVLANFRRIFFQKPIYLFFIKMSFTFLLVYQLPFVIQKLAGLISDRKLANIDWIDANLSYQFYTQQHQQWLLYFILPNFTIFFILLPLFYYYSMSKQNNKDLSYPIQGIFGYFSSDYLKQFYYWELINLMLKLTIVLIESLLNEKQLLSKKIMITILLFCYYIILSKCQPYLKQNQTKLEKSVILLCCVCSVVVVISIIQDEQVIQILCELIILILVIISFLQHLLAFFQIFYKTHEEFFYKIKSNFTHLFPNLEFRLPFLKKFLRQKMRNSNHIIRRFQILKHQLKHLKQQNLKSLRTSFNAVNEDSSGLIVSNVQRSIHQGLMIASPGQNSVIL